MFIHSCIFMCLIKNRPSASRELACSDPRAIGGGSRGDRSTE